MELQNSPAGNTRREAERVSLVGIAVDLLLTAGIIPVCFELWKHLNIWKVTEAVKGFPYTYTDLSIKTVANHLDQAYTTGLLIGLIITVISGILILLRARKGSEN